MHTTLYKINNKDLPCSIENYIQYLIIMFNGKESEKEHTYIMCVRNTESLFCTPETLKFHYTSILKSPPPKNLHIAYTPFMPLYQRKPLGRVTNWGTLRKMQL